MQTAKFQICLRDRVVWPSTTLSVAIIAGQWRTRADCTSAPTNPEHRCLHMSRNVRNRTFWYLRPARPKSANLTRIIVALMKKHPWLSKQMRKMKILIRLRKFAGWLITLLGAHVRLYVFGHCEPRGIVVRFLHYASHHENIPISFWPPKTLLLYSKTGVYRGIHYFSYFCSKT